MFWCSKLLSSDDRIRERLKTREKLGLPKPFHGFLTEPCAYDDPIVAYTKSLRQNKLGMTEKKIKRDLQKIWKDIFPEQKLTLKLRQRLEVLYLLYVSIGGLTEERRSGPSEDHLAAQLPEQALSGRNGGMTALDFFQQKERTGVCSDLAKFYRSALLASGDFSNKEVSLIHIEGRDYYGPESHMIVQVELKPDLLLDIDLTKAINYRYNPKMFFVGFGLFKHEDFGGKKIKLASDETRFVHWAHYGMIRQRGIEKEEIRTDLIQRDTVSEKALINEIPEVIDKLDDFFERSKEGLRFKIEVRTKIEGAALSEIAKQKLLEIFRKVNVFRSRYLAALCYTQASGEQIPGNHYVAYNLAYLYFKDECYLDTIEALRNAAPDDQYANAMRLYAVVLFWEFLFREFGKKALSIIRKYQKLVTLDLTVYNKEVLKGYPLNDKGFEQFIGLADEYAKFQKADIFDSNDEEIQDELVKDLNVYFKSLRGRYLELWRNNEKYWLK